MIQVQKDAIGVTIICTITENGVAVDVSAVTVKQIVLRKPDLLGTILTKTAAFTVAGVDGKIQYASIAGDLNQSGVWQAQAFVTFSGGFSGRSEIQEFEVLPNIE